MILAGILVEAAMMVFFFGVGITLIVLKGVVVARGELREKEASPLESSNSSQANPD